MTTCPQHMVHLFFLPSQSPAIRDQHLLLPKTWIPILSFPKDSSLEKFWRQSSSHVKWVRAVYPICLNYSLSRTLEAFSLMNLRPLKAIRGNVKRIAILKEPHNNIEKPWDKNGSSAPTEADSCTTGIAFASMILPLIWLSFPLLSSFYDSATIISTRIVLLSPPVRKKKVRSWQRTSSFILAWSLSSRSSSWTRMNEDRWSLGSQNLFSHICLTSWKVKIERSIPCEQVLLTVSVNSCESEQSLRSITEETWIIQV